MVSTVDFNLNGWCFLQSLPTLGITAESSHQGQYLSLNGCSVPRSWTCSYSLESQPNQVIKGNTYPLMDVRYLDHGPAAIAWDV